jgi:hypothetical protein
MTAMIFFSGVMQAKKQLVKANSWTTTILLLQQQLEHNTQANDRAIERSLAALT